MTTTITRVAAGLIIAAGLSVGSTGMAPVGHAETGSNSSRGDSESRTVRTDKPKQNVTREQINNAHRPGPSGLNGNRPRPQGFDPYKHFPKKLDQFKHLPFDPAQPGVD